MCGDALRLRQILHALIGNAVKFTQAGYVRVEADAHTLGDGRHALTVRVRDTGPGIAPEDAARMFERFRQGDGSITRAHGGTGLGLTVARGLAERMGGSLSVASEPGRGSVFCLDIPLRPAAPLAEPGSPDRNPLAA